MTKAFGEFEKEFLIPGTLILDLKLITMGLELTLVKGLGTFKMQVNWE